MANNKLRIEDKMQKIYGSMETAIGEYVWCRKHGVVFNVQAC